VIARVWRGVVRREDADAYAARALDNGLAAYSATPGNRAAWILRRDSGPCSEFVAFSLWDSLDAVRALTGRRGDLRSLPRGRPLPHWAQPPRLALRGRRKQAVRLSAGICGRPPASTSPRVWC
jgi:hypothetical protein